MWRWLTLGVPAPGENASDIQRLRFVRDLSVRSLVVFCPITVVLFVVFAVPLWGFGALAAVWLFQAGSIVRLTQQIRNDGPQ